MLFSNYCERVKLEYYSSILELDFQKITRLEDYSSSDFRYRVILDSTRTRIFVTRYSTTRYSQVPLGIGYRLVSLGSVWYP